MRQSVAKRVMLRSVGWVRGSLLMGLLWAAAGWLPAQSLTYLGTLNSLYGESEAFGVSVDGCVVVGWSYYEAPDRRGERAFRWTLEHGMQDLGTLGGPYGSEAFGVSADGRVVVGWANDADRQHCAFRWTPEGGMQRLSALPQGGWSFAYGVSADGSVMVGRATNRDGFRRAVRWVNGVIQDLGTLGGSESAAYGVSADGQVVVGWALDASGLPRAFRWVNGAMQDLGTLPGGAWSQAQGVSADGRVVVGFAGDARGSPRAVRWTPERGLEDLNLTYASLLGAGSALRVVNAVSLDGRYLVGYGWNGASGRGEAFLLDSWRAGDTNGDGCVDDGDLLNVLLAFGTPGTGAARHEDLNRDGIVDDADLLVVLFNFGSGC